eukprot:TRINITY_DN112645_c0_g1_i1.p1 TRINITY_DN112645_c0_g1~~TRINITY_DN112645_c0_g1_i1.p1  ORF type:complete len:915 (+),score=246.28 TRINITY_DN112645_c0_g1_i1:37-2745(+)
MAVAAPRRAAAAAAAAVVWITLAAVAADAATVRTVKDNEAQLLRKRPTLADATASFMALGTQEHLATLRANLTTADALQQLKGHVPSELHRFLQDKLQASGSPHAVHPHSLLAQGDAFLQARSRHTSVAVSAKHKAARSAAKSGEGASSMDVDSARAMLNTMVEKTDAKIDQEKVKCSEICSNQLRMADEAHQDMTDYNAKGASARAHIIMAQATISSAQEELPKLEVDLKAHRTKCQTERKALEGQLETVNKDAGTMEKILKMSKCAAASASLLVCKRSDDGGSSHIKFRHKGLRKAVSELQTKEIRRKLHHKVSQAIHEAHKSKHRRLHSRHASVRHRRHAKQRPMRHRRQKHHEFLSFLETDKTHFRRFVPAGELRRQKAQQRCSIRDAPSCDTLRDKFLHMRAETEDKIEDLRLDLHQMEEMCENTDRSYESQMEELGSRLKEAQTQLAEATEIDITSHEQSRLKDQQVADLTKELEKSQGSCSSNLKELAGQLCGVRQIRQELYKMDNQRPFIQDCEVSAWTPDACSATCGGGVQVQRRTVITPPSMGAGCPALTQQVSCNMQPCPIDCRVGEWSGWSACTAKCGGGIKSRSRNPKIQARHGGTPCEQTSESVICGNTACDQDCELAKWTPWSACSKACDGGFRLRERHIMEPLKGSGSCPARDSPSRLEYLRCNQKDCAPKANDGKLKCASKLDVIILLDGSGSVGDVGWAATKKAGEALVNAFKTGADGAQIAVLVFGGPDTWDGYQKCSGAGTGVDVAKDCQIKWLSHFTTDAPTLAGNVAQLAWPKGATLTAAALAAAESELGTGRQDAHSIVITVTDGRPMNPRKTTEIATRLKRRARLLWVPVTKKAPVKLIKDWASRPIADNVVALNDFTELGSVETVNKIIADACPKVE